jgi:tetratricopeptide (TPR) repeat protein
MVTLRPAASIAVSGALAAIVLTVGSARGQQVSASIEPQLVAVGGTVELTIAVDPGDLTGSVDEPGLPELPAQISVIGRGREARVEMRGLDVRRSTVFRYTLLGTSPGTARIDPIAVRVGGRTLHTDPLVLLVVDDAETARGRAAGTSPPIFVSARVDRQRAWVGQQVTLTFSFYHDPGAPLAESPDYDPPQTPGFWRVELSDDPEITSERIGGRTYQVQRFRYALFPLQPGVAEIGPARVRVVQPDEERWWEAGRPRTLATDPLTVTVDSLPNGAPPGFGGAVGSYSLSGALPAREVVAGSPIELALTVEGTGNPAAVSAPELPDWPEIEVGAPNVETESDLNGQRLGGRATFRWILVPRNDGTLDLGAARLPYFDPDRGAYAVDTLRLGELRVSPGTLARSHEAAEPFRGPTLWEPRTPRAPALRGLADSPLYWAALAGPWLGWLAVLGWRRRPRRPAAAGADALDILVAARLALESRGAAATTEARHAVERSLALRYGVPVAGLSPRERAEKLERRGAPRAVVEAAGAALVAIDGVRFGGAGLDAAVGAVERLTAAMAAKRGAARAGAAGAALLALAVAASVAGPASAAAQPTRALVQDTPGGRDSLESASAAAVWSDANRAYRAGDMAAAAAVYEALAARHADPRIEANLAAARWRQGRRGEALACYREALALTPRDPTIRADELRLWNELQRPPRLGPTSRALSAVRLDEILIALLVASWVAAVGTALAGRDRRARPVAAVALATVALLAMTAALHAIAVDGPRRGIATAGAEVHATPGGERIAALPEGALVRVLERAPDGWRVRASGLPAGWVAPDRIVPLD